MSDHRNFTANAGCTWDRFVPRGESIERLSVMRSGSRQATKRRRTRTEARGCLDLSLGETSGERQLAQSPSVRRGVRTIAVSPRPACRCTLELERVVSLTDENFDLSLRTNIFVGRDATGRFLAGGTRGTVGVFAPDGRLQFAVGRAGSGPGEFREPYALYFTRGDSVVVLDRAIRRVTVFDPKTMRVVRSFPLEGSSTNHVFALGGESLVVDGVFGGAGIGKSVHQLSATGAYVRSVSADTAIIGRQSFRMLNRAFDHAKAGFFSGAELSISN